MASRNYNKASLERQSKSLTRCRLLLGSTRRITPERIPQANVMGVSASRETGKGVIKLDTPIIRASPNSKSVKIITQFVFCP